MQVNADESLFLRVQRYARLAPGALVLLGLLLAHYTPTEVTISTGFAAAPVVASALQSTRGTVVIGLASTGATAVVAETYTQDTVLEDVLRTVTVGSLSVLAVGVSLLLKRRAERLASARGAAAALQLAVLPAPPARIGSLGVATRYQVAQSEATIGGDMYAVQRTPYGTRLLVGDVRGKGLGAVGAVVIVIGAFREAAEQEEKLERVAARLEGALRREGSRREGTYDQSEGFTTAVLVEIPSGRPSLLRIVNRGHPPPLLLHRGVARMLEPTVPALPLGIPEVGEWPDHPDETPFPEGAQLLLYTDGLSEARDRHGTFYDPVNRLSGRAFEGPEQLLSTVAADVEEHTPEGLDDDMALLAVERRVDDAAEQPEGGGARAVE